MKIVFAFDLLKNQIEQNLTASLSKLYAATSSLFLTTYVTYIYIYQFNIHMYIILHMYIAEGKAKFCYFKTIDGCYSQYKMTVV